MQTENKNNTNLFSSTLRTRINNYFNDNHKISKANKSMKFKIFLSLFFWAISYALIFIFSTSKITFLFFYILHGTTHIFFSFNVGHDALHNAISKKSSINRLWAYSYDLLGVNTYMWRFMHHQGHHNCLNITGEDMSLETSGIMRLSDKSEKRNYHKFQHIYALLVYGLYLIYYVFIKDFKYFFSKKNTYLKEVNHPSIEYFKLFLGKFFYVMYMFFFPLYFLSFSFSFILISFLVNLFIIGIIMSLTFQVTHIVEETAYPKDKNVYTNYIQHVFATTADFSTTNKISNYFFGGLNLHVIHHLRSDICHIHYPELTKIVKLTAKEFGIKYRENKTFFDGIKSHLIQLKKLGNS